jgi:hypothetical protein
VARGLARSRWASLIQAARVKLCRPTRPLPPTARSRVAHDADAQSASMAASVAWSVVSTWHKDSYAVFIDGFMVKRRTRCARSRRPSHTGEAWHRGGWNSPMRNGVLMMAAGGGVHNSSGGTYTSSRGSRPRYYIKKGKRIARRGGSPKGGDWWRLGTGAAVLR